MFYVSQHSYAMKIHCFLFLFAILSTFQLNARQPGGNSALLVIDMQDEFTRHTLDNARATTLISNVNESIALLRPMKVIFVKADIRMLTISLKGIKTESSEHTDLDGRLDRREEDLVLTKHESSALTLEELNSLLEEHQIGHLYLAGVFLGQCLTNTALHAQEEGYNVTVIREAVAARNQKKSDKFLKKLEARGIGVIQLSNLH